ncbi:MAG: Ig-like domain-containing protein [Flavobacteriaceae bacterium]
MKSIVAALTCAVALVIAGSAGAETWKVKANAATLVGWHAVYSEIGCELRPPEKYEVARQPGHGRIALPVRPVTSDSTENGCRGFKGTAVTVTYTPAPGYRGPDTFSIRVTYEEYLDPPMTSDVTRYDVNVQ